MATFPKKCFDPSETKIVPFTSNLRKQTKAIINISKLPKNYLCVIALLKRCHNRWIPENLVKVTIEKIALILYNSL